jgi:hypothetical protein
MARRRGTETVGDMIRSISLVLVPVALVAAVAILSSPRTPAVRDVDAAPAIEAARQAAPFTVVTPEPVPSSWSTTNASLDGGGDVATLRLDYVAADGGYVGFVQTNDGEAADVVLALLPDAAPDGSSDVDGQAWERWRENGVQDPDVALVRQGDDSVVLLVGSGDYSALEDVASRLR